MRPDQLARGSRLFVDATVFLYHLADQNPQCSLVLTRLEESFWKGFTSLLVLEEVAFKGLMAEVVQSLGWSTQRVVQNLRQKPEETKKLLRPWDELRALASLVTVIEPTLPDFLRCREVQQQFGLFGNDALSAVLMRRAGIGHIATTDRDFDRLDFAQRIEVEVG